LFVIEEEKKKCKFGRKKRETYKTIKPCAFFLLRLSFTRHTPERLFSSNCALRERERERGRDTETEKKNFNDQDIFIKYEGRMSNVPSVRGKLCILGLKAFSTTTNKRREKNKPSELYILCAK
jgi:hypothetical protein